jgi:hypothetical protein
MRGIAARLTHTTLLTAALFLAGCMGSTSPTGPGSTGDPVFNEDYQSADLDAADGGFTATDESPYFGSEAIQKMQEGEVAANDDLAFDGGLLEGDPTYDVYFLRIAWGQLDGDSADGAGTDWSGSIALDRGAIKVERIIRFEREQGDHVVPREDRRKVEFVSHTRRGLDGLLLRVHVPQVDIATPNMITLTTPVFTKSYEVGQLDGLAEVFTVDDLGNQVSFRAERIPPFPCLAGYMTGFWLMNHEGTRGAFGGVWVADDGRPAGYLRGVFGVNAEGKRVLFGKWISLSGAFRGILRGTYEVNAEGGGTFEGHWVNRFHQAEGGFAGHFRIREDRRAGLFEGRWRTKCDLPMR